MSLTIAVIQTGPQMFLVLFFCFLSGWVSSLSCLLISCCNLVIGSSLNSFQVDFNCTYGKSLVLLKVLSLPLVQALYSSSRVMIMVCVMT